MRKDSLIRNAQVMLGVCVLFAICAVCAPIYGLCGLFGLRDEDVELEP